MTPTGGPPHPTPMNDHPRSPHRGWTFVEMLVAISLSAIFMGAATLVFSSISANSKRLTRIVEVDIGESASSNFYGRSDDTVRIYAAPNYGKAAFAQEFRERMLEDARHSSAIYCLPRSAENTVRPEFLRYTAGDEGSTEARPRLDTPEAFRSFLASVEPTSTAIYDTPIRNVPDPARADASIYMIAPDPDPGHLRVRAVYEIDLVSPGNRDGIYASVRRYRNGALTHYYDVFYESGPGEAFHPLFVAFERRARSAVAEGSAIDRFKVSAGAPFYLIWLPDPAINPYRVRTSAPAVDPDSPRAAYEHMAGRSSFLVALPMFPSL